MKKYLTKIIISVLFLIFSYLCYWLPPKPYTEIIKFSETRSVQREVNNEAKLFEWIGILFLALSVWTWRKELKLTSIGPISGPPLVEQREAEEVSRELLRKEQIETKTNFIKYDYHKDREDKLKNRILALAKEKRVLNSSYVALDLAVSRDTAERYLYILSKEGKLRQDGFPRSIYTLANSYENLAIEKLKKELKEKTEILSDRRFVRVKGKYEIDALLKGNNLTFLIELKFVRNSLESEALLKAYDQLTKAGDTFHEDNIELYLILIVDDDVSKKALEKSNQHISFDSGNYPFIIKVYSKNDLDTKST